MQINIVLKSCKLLLFIHFFKSVFVNVCKMFYVQTYKRLKKININAIEIEWLANETINDVYVTMFCVFDLVNVENTSGI